MLCCNALGTHCRPIYDTQIHLCSFELCVKTNTSLFVFQRVTNNVIRHISWHLTYVYQAVLQDI